MDFIQLVPVRNESGSVTALYGLEAGGTVWYGHLIWTGREGGGPSTIQWYPVDSKLGEQE
jgi:hypothetical protein